MQMHIFFLTVQLSHALTTASLQLIVPFNYVLNIFEEITKYVVNGATAPLTSV